MMSVFSLIEALLNYAEKNGLSTTADRVYLRNSLLAALCLDTYEAPAFVPEMPLEELLSAIDDYAFENGLIDDNGVTARDLFDTKLMGILTPRPSTVICAFDTLYETSPETATDWFYSFSRATDYIRTYRVKKDLKWRVPSAYGEIDVTINLSKPEKDPKAIAAAKSLPQSGYPKCLLCADCEGYAGNLRFPARENHRIIPLTLADESWFLQYSPYVYYPEHCIVLDSRHIPMKIDRTTFRRLLDFETKFPHYFLGSNADLPIVGGSILSHNHFQGGHYTFAMEKAPIEQEISFAGYEDIRAGIVHWPLSVVRLDSADKERLIDLADKILLAWRGYTDEDATVFAETNGEPHNTITPIARRRGGDYELDLVLRNNLTTDEHPLGVYHPHADKHNIKKENIGLIEVMGLAVLPARLKSEMKTLAEAILAGRDIRADETIAKHADWLARFRNQNVFTPDNTEEILRTEIGKTFVAVLEDAGVYKCTEAGREAFLRFVRAAGGDKR